MATQIVAPPSDCFFLSGTLEPVGTMKANIWGKKAGSIYQLIFVETLVLSILLVPQTIHSV